MAVVVAAAVVAAAVMVRGGGGGGGSASADCRFRYSTAVARVMGRRSSATETQGASRLSERDCPLVQCGCGGAVTRSSETTGLSEGSSKVLRFSENEQVDGRVMRRWKGGRYRRRRVMDEAKQAETPPIRMPQ